MADVGEPWIVWRKSSASNSGACVEVVVVGGSVLIRDSMNPYEGVLRLSPVAWSVFLASARSKDFVLRQA